MASNRYLTDEELQMLNELCRHDASPPTITLTMLMDANIRPLLDQASHLELKLELGDIRLSFPVALTSLSEAQEQAELSVPEILSNSAHPRAWRLPSPQGLQLSQPNGKPLAAEIRDLSINGMRLLSRRCLFRRHKSKLVRLELGQEHNILLKLKLVRQHRARHFWLAAVQFELPVADRMTLSDYVFRGFLEAIYREQAE
ncbi:hypothetical protein C7H85_05710 [Zobellella endophytica]|uniref:PilZ domain-containing protein n=2 Tax=Zobellella endophytica TaxID=2116700 RepID=A0A2P7R7E5_9GAMM|nr:hypothetical protein C7H85_05710 [Zobellella endophytica]